MRGKGVAYGAGGIVGGITPAYAGKSYPLLSVEQFGRDHPRVCGEKPTTILPASAKWGSPPRMRGKVCCRSPPRGAARITPAYAGKSVYLLA